MKQEKAGGIKKKERNKSMLIFVGIFLCMMFAVAVFSACNAVKKYGSEGKAIKENKNSYERYLEVINPDKITTEHITEAVCYSREMSEEEGVRYRSLQDRYKEGEMAPKEEIDIVDKLEDTDREVEYPVFEIWNHEYFLPERTLTDEDMLRMIDFEYKLSDATMQRCKELAKAAETSPHKVEEDEAMEIAGSAIEKMFNIVTLSMDKEALYNGAASYIVSFREKSGSILYEAMVGMGTGKLEWVREYHNELGMENAVEINQEFEQICSANYQKAKALLTDILSSDIEIVSSSCRYRTDKSGKEIPKGEAGIIHYYFQMEDGMVYHMKYDIERKRFYALDEEEKKYTFYKTEEELKEEGAKKDGDKFIEPLLGAEMEVAQNKDLQWVVSFIE